MRLITFGRPHVARPNAGERITLQPLPIAVLAYLAVGGPRTRDHLADLFWHGSKNRLNSLSTTLNRIRAEVPNGVWVQGHTMVGTDLATDIGELREAIHSSEFERVADLYVAPFLGGLKLRRQSQEFEEWVLAERATLAATVELALLQRARVLFEGGEHQSAANIAEQAWDIAVRDGFPSPDHFDAYHRIFASVARPSANAVRAMAEEFGIELLPVAAIVFDSDAELATATESFGMSAGPTAQLFGCQEELRAIESSVAAHALTTVVGLGGAGKTRLASEFFASAAVDRDYPHRYWVDLRNVVDHVLVAPTIASALDQRFEDVASIASRLPTDESVLIVLDNYEHLLKAAEIVHQLVNENAAIRVLATSRVPLDLADESIVQLSGLDISDGEVDSPAEQLFASAARRAGVGDDRLVGETRAAIREVCRRVGGNPLALEIAGAWAKVLTPAEIAETLADDNELLGSPMAGELRAMDTVLDQSWASLSETEQDTLMLLATFPSGCLAKEALKLQGLSIKSIGRLVQHSLVRLLPQDRITLHPLIASHALAELAQRPKLQEQFHGVLSAWCQSYSAAVQVNAASTHSQAYAADIANFTSAWAWDARHGRWELHAATVEPLDRFFKDSGRLTEGLALFGMVADAVRSDPSGPPQLLAALLEALGALHTFSGDLIQARALLDEALVVSPDDDSGGRARILRTLGAMQLNSGEVDEAKANFKTGLALLDGNTGAGALKASITLDLAQVYHYEGDQEQAEQAARMALQAGRAVDDYVVITVSYLLLAAIAIESDPHRAIVLLNEGAIVAEEASLDSSAIYLSFFSGLAHLKLDEAEQAEAHFTEGLQAATEAGQLAMVGANSIGRAEARLALQTTVDAVDDLKIGIRLALKTGNGRYLMWAAVVSCRAAAEERPPNANMRELLMLVLRHPTADPDARNKAAASLQELFNEPKPPELLDSDSVADEDAASLDEVAERSLQLLI